MLESVAVVGIGAMGAPMARRLIDGGFRLTVCDANEDALRPFAGDDVRATTRPADCAAADLVLILVATARQVNDVLLGADGIASGLAPGRPLRVAVMSTVGREAILGLVHALEGSPLRLIDAPVSGGPLRAREGSLTVLMGGSSSDVEMARPVLEQLGRQLFHCGPVGDAQTTKVVNNILGMLNTMTSAEAHRVAVENGLDLTDTARILEVSTGRNWLSARPGDVSATFAAYAGTREAFASTAATMRKDAALALELLSQSEGSFPVLEGVAALVESLGDETFDNWNAVGCARPPESRT